MGRGPPRTPAFLLRGYSAVVDSAPRAQQKRDRPLVTADDLGMAFDRADKLIRGGHPELLKQAGSVIRDAAERFCKEMLVKDRRPLPLSTTATKILDTLARRSSRC
jgi:hypothetical protein